MNRDKIIQKSMKKLAYGLNGKIPDEEMEKYMQEFQRFFSKMKEDDKEGPKAFLKYFEYDLIKPKQYKKEQVQEILAKAKMEGLIKKTVVKNSYMERAWRSILKYYDLQGFTLGV